MKFVDREKFLSIYKNNPSIDELRSAVCVTSYDEYVSKGGTRNQFQLYAKIKERGKELESNYIQGCDMKFSGISIAMNSLMYSKFLAQCYYILLNMLFQEPLRVVDYSMFDYREFERF